MECYVWFRNVGVHAVDIVRCHIVGIWIGAPKEGGRRVVFQGLLLPLSLLVEDIIGCLPCI